MNTVSHAVTNWFLVFGHIPFTFYKRLLWLPCGSKINLNWWIYRNWWTSIKKILFAIKFHFLGGNMRCLFNWVAVQMKNGREFLLTDTVGFIQKLPTMLVTIVFLPIVYTSVGAWCLGNLVLMLISIGCGLQSNIGGDIRIIAFGARSGH